MDRDIASGNKPMEPRLREVSNVVDKITKPHGECGGEALKERCKSYRGREDCIYGDKNRRHDYSGQCSAYDRLIPSDQYSI